MNAYVYQADLWCEECAEEIMARLDSTIRETAEAEVDIEIERLEKSLGIDLSDSPKMRERLVNKRAKAIGHDLEDESSYDSDEYPKGPYPNGGGESDSPQHCADCREFLENPLTSDGYDYVRENQNDEWDSFYEIDRESGAQGDD
jgi:hypothetical protein